MTPFRETIGPRVNALRAIGKDLIELAWMFFAAAQWFVAVAMPSFFLAALICLLVGHPLSVHLHDTTLISFKGYFYTYLLFLAMTVFAFYYLLKMRKQGEPVFSHKCYIMALYLSVFLTLSYKIEVSEQRYVLKNIRYSETTIRLYDADTQQPLNNVSLLGPPVSSHSALPKKYSISTLQSYGFVITLIDIKPVEVGFTAPGYETQRIKIGKKEGEEAVSVLLKKETAAETEIKPPSEKASNPDPNTPSQ